MNNVTRLPTAATSYYTVRKSSKPGWCAVTLVTPMPGRRPLATGLFAINNRDTAIAEAKETAARMERPFKMRGVS